MRLLPLALLCSVTLARAQFPASPTPPPAATVVTDCQTTPQIHSAVLRSQPEGRMAPGSLSSIVFWTDLTITCNYTGSVQHLQLPASTDHGPLTVDAFGAAGGAVSFSGGIPGGPVTTGGLGAQVHATLNLAPGTQLQIRAGGAGADRGTNTANGGSWNGGGLTFADQYEIPGPFSSEAGAGGGASDVRIAPFTEAQRLVVAGGGGGAGSNSPGGNDSGPRGGNGGRNGGDGLHGQPDMVFDPNPPHYGGYGGTQTAPGAGGAPDKYPGSNPGNPGLGSSGATATRDNGSGYGGGGGAGLFGGGSGSDRAAGGGGGGSSAAAPNDATAQITDGQRAGNGQVIFHYRVFTRRTPCVEINPSIVSRTARYANPSCHNFVPQ